MRAFLATALIFALVIAGISLWGSVHAKRMAFSLSQIVIDGTPVCIMQHGGEIRAMVGMCDTPGNELQEDGFGTSGGFHGGTHYPFDPRLRLPPGHPPVESAPAFEKKRRIPI